MLNKDLQAFNSESVKDDDATSVSSPSLSSPSLSSPSLLTRSLSSKLNLDDLEGRVVAGRYKIIRRIGKGGMGVVYLATQSNLNRDVVIKILAPQLVDDDSSVIRFEREARGLSRLQHPNIVTIYDFGQDDDLAYIAMEYADGETLSKYIKRAAPLNLIDFLPIAVQILKGIGEAHKLGLIHRDIKPANIILCELEGEKNFVKILDFGLAKLAQGQEDVTKEQQLVGSASFLAPEQILEGQSDPRTDVYALGVLFFMLLTGKKPFTGPNDNVILYKHVNERAQKLSTLVSEEQGIPQTLCDVIDKCLEKDPAIRPQDANALLSSISLSLDAPELRSAWSSISLAKVDLSKLIEEDQETKLHTPTSGQHVPVSPLRSPTIVMNNPVQSPGPKKRKRKYLYIYILAFIVLILALTALYIRITSLNQAKQNSQTQSLDESANLRKYQQILDAVQVEVDEKRWQNAEELLANYDESLKKSPELITRATHLKGLIEVGKLSTQAQVLESTAPQDALKIYQQILALDASQEEAARKISEIQSLIEAQSKATFVFSSKESLEGAKLYINNADQGAVPESLQLEAGEYQIKITKDGYRDWNKQIKVKAGENIDLQVEMSKRSSRGSSGKTQDSNLLLNKSGVKNSDLLLK